MKLHINHINSIYCTALIYFISLKTSGLLSAISVKSLLAPSDLCFALSQPSLTQTYDPSPASPARCFGIEITCMSLVSALWFTPVLSSLSLPGCRSPYMSPRISLRSSCSLKALGVLAPALIPFLMYLNVLWGGYAPSLRHDSSR